MNTDLFPIGNLAILISSNMKSSFSDNLFSIAPLIALRISADNSLLLYFPKLVSDFY